MKWIGECRSRQPVAVQSSTFQAPRCSLLASVFRGAIVLADKYADEIAVDSGTLSFEAFRDVAALLYRAG